MRATKGETRRLVEARSFERLCDLERERGGVFRYLRSLAYDRDSLIYWQAVEAAGRLAACLAVSHTESVRSFARRLLWALSDESGDMAWSGPEMLAEIFLADPERFGDLGPVVIHLDELIFRKNALWCAGRIAQEHPDLVEEVRPELIRGTRDPDPELRAYAAWALGALGGADALESVSALADDDGGPVVFYRRGRLDRLRVRDFAAEALARLAPGVERMER